MSLDETKLLAAARECERFAKSLGSLIEIAPFLTQMGSLTQAANEAQARIDAINQQAVDAQATLDHLLERHDAIKQANADAEAALARAKDDAAAAIAERHNALAKDVDEAKATAQAILDKAADDAKLLSDKLDEALQRKRDALKAMDDDIAAKRAAADAEEARHAAATDKIAKLREAL